MSDEYIFGERRVPTHRLAKESECSACGLLKCAGIEVDTADTYGPQGDPRDAGGEWPIVLCWFCVAALTAIAATEAPR